MTSTLNIHLTHFSCTHTRFIYTRYKTDSEACAECAFKPATDLSTDIKINFFSSILLRQRHVAAEKYWQIDECQHHC